MGITIRPSSIHDDSHNSSGASSSCNTNATKKRWSNLMPFFVVLVVLAEIAFLGRLDIAKNAALLADSFYQFTSPSWSSLPAAAGDEVVLSGVDRRSEADGCEKWLEREDSVEYSRDFEKEPILVNGGDQVLSRMCYKIWIFLIVGHGASFMLAECHICKRVTPFFLTL